MERVRTYPSEVVTSTIQNFGEYQMVFSMQEITVDGIPSSRDNLNGERSMHIGPLFMVKQMPDIADENEDGYLIECADWDDPYRPLERKNGEIDEEIWIYCGLLMGTNDYEYEYYREVVEDKKAARAA
jgi:hypothetical protein